MNGETFKGENFSEFGEYTGPVEATDTIKLKNPEKTVGRFVTVVIPETDSLAISDVKVFVAPEEEPEVCFVI